MTTSIGFVIQPGQPIPDDVTEVKDGAKSPWRLTSKGHWHLRTAQITCLNDDCGGDGRSLMRQVGQRLTVTAVREQPGKPCWKCGLTVGEIVDRGAGAFADGRLRFMHAYGECPTADQLAQHTAEGIAEPLNINGLIRDSREIMALLGVTEPADVLPELARRLAAPEPQQADASPLLDLARQYAQRWAAFCVTKVGGNDGASDKAKADALLARIAALVPQQPVQARDAHGNLWWIHDCGEVAGDSERPGPDWCGQADPESWRPLLVGGDPAPEPTESRAAYWERRFNEEAARGDQAAQQILTLHRERDEARAEVEHERKNAAYLHEIIAEFKAAQPDSLVLSLPEVPEGTEALVGESSGARYPWNAELQGWLFDQAEIGTTGLGELLDREGSVRVELAPPREPRTDLPCGHLIESSKVEDDDGAEVLIIVPPEYDSNGDVVTTSLVWCAQGHGWVALTPAEYAEVTG